MRLSSSTNASSSAFSAVESPNIFAIPKTLPTMSLPRLPNPLITFPNILGFALTTCLMLLLTAIRLTTSALAASGKSGFLSKNCCSR